MLDLSRDEKAVIRFHDKVDFPLSGVSVLRNGVVWVDVEQWGDLVVHPGFHNLAGTVAVKGHFADGLFLSLRFPAFRLRHGYGATARQALHGGCRAGFMKTKPADALCASAR